MNGFEALIGEVAATVQPIFKQAIDTVMPVYKQIVQQQDQAARNIAENMKRERLREPYDRYQMRKWLSQVPHGGIVGDKAVLIVYNSEAPELSEMIVEDI